MDYLKVREAALKYQISEKTIRKWITSKQLPSTTRVVNGVQQYALLAEDIEAIIAEKSLEPKSPALVELAEGLQSQVLGQVGQPSPDTKEQITALASELSYQGEIIEAMKAELEALRNRVSVLERGKKSARPVVADVNYSVPSQKAAEAHAPDVPTVDKSPHGQRVQTPRSTPSTSTRPDLPDTWSSWTPFIERHNINAESRRLLKEIKREDFCEPGEYMQPSARGKTLVKCALSPSGQARLLEAIKALPIGQELTQCEVEGCPCHQIV